MTGDREKCTEEEVEKINHKEAERVREMDGGREGRREERDEVI